MEISLLFSHWGCLFSCTKVNRPNVCYMYVLSVLNYLVSRVLILKVFIAFSTFSFLSHRGIQMMYYGRGMLLISTGVMLYHDQQNRLFCSLLYFSSLAAERTWGAIKTGKTTTKLVWKMVYNGKDFAVITLNPTPAVVFSL